MGDYPNAMANARASDTASVTDLWCKSTIVSFPVPTPFLIYNFPSAVLIANSRNDKLLVVGALPDDALDFNLIVVAI